MGVLLSEQFEEDSSDDDDDDDDLLFIGAGGHVLFLGIRNFLPLGVEHPLLEISTQLI